MKIFRWSTLALVVVGLTANVFADDAVKKETKTTVTKTTKTTTQQPEMKAMSPEEQAMMDAWMKAATPGDPHKKLEPFVGNFDVKVKSWMSPGAPPMESTGTSENKWTLGGRYVEQKFKGSVMDQPFEGLGYTGYDNVKKQYVGTWMDNMSTAVMMSSGSLKPDGKTMEMEGNMVDAMTGKDALIKSKIVIADNDHHTMEMWGPAPDGTMYKSMVIEYVRKK